MSHSQQKNHRLYDMLAPYVLELFREEWSDGPRLQFTRCDLSKDGKYLELFFSGETQTKDILLGLRKRNILIRRHLADLHVLSRLPEIRIQFDRGESSGRSVEDILAEIRQANKQN